jgi:hypothetical protein
MYDIEYDSILGCYCLHYRGEVICLQSRTLRAADTEAEHIMAVWDNETVDN